MSSSLFYSKSTSRNGSGSCLHVLLSHTTFAVAREAMSVQLSGILSACKRRTSASSAVRRFSVLMNHMRAENTSHGQRMASTAAQDEVLFEYVGERENGCYQLITMNRPKALNALNLNMIQLITKNMKAVADDDSVRLVVLKGAGDKAFCAGGDIRAVTEAGKVGDPLSRQFFLEEYNLNHYIGIYKKPFIAIIDGITMGGGVGLSVHGPFRVATEYTFFAMPETFIGLFPDVGGSYFLPRLSGSLGMFLALTGHRLKGRDVLHAGIATHFIAREKIPMLEQELANVCVRKLSPADAQDNYATVREVLDDFHKQCLNVDARSFSLDPDLENINRCFDKETVEGILAALEADGSDWARKQIETLNKMSPTAMKVTHRELMEGAKLTFAECFKMEYRLSQGCMAGNDFYEGVRAVIVDKDQAPKWNPPTLDEVTPEIVQRHFAPPTDGSELELRL